MLCTVRSAGERSLRENSDHFRQLSGRRDDEEELKFTKALRWGVLTTAGSLFLGRSRLHSPLFNTMGSTKFHLLRNASLATSELTAA